RTWCATSRWCRCCWCAGRPLRRKRAADRAMVKARRAEAPMSASVEDYLKTIYTLAGAKGEAATNDIAERLDLAPGSVTGMVRRLAEKGFLAYERYRGVKLTPAGRSAALRTVRRHRVIETYLSRELGYDFDSVHD